MESRLGNPGAFFIPAAGDPTILTGRRNAPSFGRDVAPQRRLTGTIGLPVGLQQPDKRESSDKDLPGPSWADRLE